MDEEAGLGATGGDLVEDRVERHLPITEVPDAEAQNEERGGHPPGHGDLQAGEVLARQRLARHHDRPVARAHARPVRKQDVALLDERIRM